MLYHPLEEVRGIAINCLDLLKEKYPSSFSHREDKNKTEYIRKNSTEIHYSNYINESWDNDTFIYKNNIDNNILETEVLGMIEQRPKWTNLPKLIEKYGNYTCQFLIDYGSFRDLQRHRNGLCRIPLLSNRHGFNPWYLIQLPADIKNEANKLLKDQFLAISKVKDIKELDDFQLQYYFPIGCNINCELVYGLPEMVYVTELRSSSTVHPTLRKIAHKMHHILSTNHPKLKLYSDINSDTWDIKRGNQDIESISR